MAVAISSMFRPSLYSTDLRPDMAFGVLGICCGIAGRHCYYLGPDGVFVDFAVDGCYLTVAMIDIEKVKPEIERVCRHFPVKRLGLFGSAVSRDFSQTSDVDVLVIFDAGENIDLFDTYFALKEKLEKIFEREVDLLIDRKFKNPVLRESIDRTRIVIYER